DHAAWKPWDACALIAANRGLGRERLPILVDQGEADEYRDLQLKPEVLRASAETSGYPLMLRCRPGYDHSYFFVASFIEEHLRYPAECLAWTGRPPAGSGRISRRFPAGRSCLRVGPGFGVPRFGEGDFISLGGVRIPHKFGLVAHSDGDVALHALSDALLGAVAPGETGRHFPDPDPTFTGADSRAPLRHVARLVRDKGWQVGNVDLTNQRQTPERAPHIP